MYVCMDHKPQEHQSALHPLSWSSTVKHVLQQPLLHSLPVDVSSARIHALVRRDTHVREKRSQIANRVDLAQRVQHGPPHRLCRRARWEADGGRDRWKRDMAALGSRALLPQANSEVSRGNNVRVCVHVQCLGWEDCPRCPRADQTWLRDSNRRGGTRRRPCRSQTSIGVWDAHVSGLKASTHTGGGVHLEFGSLESQEQI